MRNKHKPAAPLSAQPAAPLPYVITCVCGQTVSGTRASHHQVITCPGCRRKLFVLPASPWPASEEELAKLTVIRLAAAAQPPPRIAAARPRWLQPLLAGVITLVLVVTGLVAFWSYLFPVRAGSRGAELRQQAANARAELGQKNLAQARITLDALHNELERPPADLAPEEVRQLHHLHRQVELATTLLRPSLEELLVEAHQTPAQQWTAHFEQSHKGRGVIFDALIETNPNGDPDFRLDYVLEAQGIPGRIALADFAQAKELWRTPEPRRWLFGGKLAALRLEADPAKRPGQWVVRFQPNSLVLLTDGQVLQALGLSQELEWEAIFLRQTGLVPLRRPLALPVKLRPGDLAEDVRREHGPPDRVSRQVLSGRYIEQWTYQRRPVWRVNFECHPDKPLRVASLGPQQPK